MTSYEQFMAMLDHPPTAEQEAVIRSEAPAIAVIAGAGSGKTQTMSQRIVWHIVNGNVRPDQVLGLTFTNKAAGELDQRVTEQLRVAAARGLLTNDEGADEQGGVLGESAASDDARAAHTHRSLAKPTIATYNSFASEIASAYAMLIGEDPRARLITDAERFQIMSTIVAGVDDSLPHLVPLQTAAISHIVTSALALTDELVGNSVAPEDFRIFAELERDAMEQATSLNPPRGQKKFINKAFETAKAAVDKLDFRIALSYIVERYIAYKQEHSLIEFSDQVVRAKKILDAVPAVGEELRERYKLILLDEYQDTSVGQAAFLQAAFVGADSVCAVGDPNQAIYAWRGASAAALADFMARFNVDKNADGTYQNLTLSTAFRNSPTILAAANALTEGKLTYPDMTVKKLSAFGDKPGEAVHVHRHLREDSYLDMAREIASFFERAKESGAHEPPTAAILVRARRYMDPAIDALEQFGLDYEVVGGEALIDRPELRLVRSLLGVVVNPDRSDLLMPLMNFYAIGSKDLRALADYAAKLSAGAEERLARQDGPRVGINLVEALHDLREQVRSGQGELPEGMSSQGLSRMVRLSANIVSVEERRHLDLPQVIETAISELGLRTYAQARTAGGARVEAALGAFIRLGAQFTANVPEGSLRDFVAWIDAIEEHENVGESESGADVLLFDVDKPEPRSGVVQILTVHGAKGLEWDVVAIPNMNAGGFDYQAKTTTWHKSSSALPHALREDAAHLPDFQMQRKLLAYPDYSPEDVREVFDDFTDYLEETLHKYHANEERRLAYVAVTRAKSMLIIASYDLDEAAKAALAYKRLERQVEANPGSGDVDTARLESNTFVADMGAHLSAATGNDEPLTGAQLRDVIERGEDGSDAEQDVVYWPDDVDRRLDTQAVASREPTSDELAQLVQRWNQMAAVVVADHQPTTDQRVLREYLTASDVVNLARDPQGFIADQRRPIPHEPSRAARMGTIVHEQIAHHFQAPTTLDVDSVAHPGQMPLDSAPALSSKQQATLLERFEESVYASCPPIAIEEAIDVFVAGRPIRCVIDAVLDTSSLPGYPPVTIVDWKTGRRPGASEVASRELQLGLYRLAWCAATGTELSDVGACFYYLGEKSAARRELHAGDLTEEQIGQIIADHLDG
ncbi:ATP-dependent DNA helicase [Trueperella bialowiezensis]|uniref:DNA 3'-5' helicase n=1 Tax=Trueperella bialowiezensis TaxID=312285 RepID=A0A448PGA5_9ACTO|nr:ATP-dependent DNA helicase [Trueperella bialowiezensis]VEI13952.1 ATP-dependent DNA helicase pcrA [Trueperella bialowiezensis]